MEVACQSKRAIENLQCKFYDVKTLHLLKENTLLNKHEIHFVYFQNVVREFSLCSRGTW